MNSCERVATALRLGQPDVVPIVEFVIDEKIARAIIPDIVDVQDFMDRIGLDAVSCGAIWNTLSTGPNGTYTDEWGVTYASGGSEAVAHPLDGPIRTMADATAYKPPGPEAPHRLTAVRRTVARYKGRRAIVMHHRAAFMWSAYLMGLDNLLAALLVEPDLAVAVMDKVLETNIRIVRSAIREGVEVVVLGDDYAHNGGPLMSPEVFGEFILPRLARMVSMIHEEGAYCIKHSDGNIYPLLGMIVSTGCDGINPIEPVAGMDLATVKEMVGDRVCITGNIDCGELLSHGTVEQVEDAVRQAIADAAAGGGYMLTSSNSIHSSVNPRNFAAMIAAGKSYGVYDS